MENVPPDRLQSLRPKHNFIWYRLPYEGLPRNKLHSDISFQHKCTQWYSMACIVVKLTIITKTYLLLQLGQSEPDQRLLQMSQFTKEIVRSGPRCQGNVAAETNK